MKEKYFLVLLIPAFLLLGCNSKELERLRSENDSLRRELKTRYSVVLTMREIKFLIDSIDISRNALHATLNEGTTYEDFSERMKNINDYVIKTGNKLDSIEQNLKSSESDASAYLMMVSALKSELQIRADEAEQLEKQVSEYKSENKGLLKTLKLQENQIVEMRSKIEVKQQELNFIEAKVTEMVENFKVTEAEAYYARAQAVEEAANRTRLAPNKKRETYKEAIELYKKALSLGKSEAQQNINALRKKVN